MALKGAKILRFSIYCFKNVKFHNIVKLFIHFLSFITLLLGLKFKYSSTFGSIFHLPDQDAEFTWLQVPLLLVTEDVIKNNVNVRFWNRNTCSLSDE